MHEGIRWFQVVSLMRESSVSLFSLYGKPISLSDILSVSLSTNES